MVLAGLHEAVDTLDIAVDGAELLSAMAARDKLDARIAATLAGFDEAQLFDTDGSVSTAAWLRRHTGLSQGQASRLTTTARRASAMPPVADAWADGRLTSAQVEVICRHVGDRFTTRFTDHAPALLPVLAPLAVPQLVVAMRDWRARADADADTRPDDRPDPEPAEAPSELHLSGLLDGRRAVDGDLDVELGELLATALRLADSGDRTLPRSQRQAEALGVVLRDFLDHQHHHRAGRHRPHLNLIFDTDSGRATTLSGIPMPDTTISRLLCDSILHRVLAAGSTVLDYGRATRTIPANLWNAVVVRDRGCRFPGCDRPAHWCEAHHVWSWEDGGPTNLDNTVLFCTRHHHLVHKPGWHAKLLPDATLEITRPSGEVDTTRPPPRGSPLNAEARSSPRAA